MISIIFFLLLAIVILLAYNKNKIMETFKSTSDDVKKYNMKSCKDRIDKYEISGYPTIIIIDKRDSEKKLEEYNDERKYDIMKNFVEKYINM